MVIPVSPSPIRTIKASLPAPASAPVMAEDLHAGAVKGSNRPPNRVANRLIMDTVEHFKGTVKRPTKITKDVTISIKSDEPPQALPPKGYLTVTRSSIFRFFNDEERCIVTLQTRSFGLYKFYARDLDELRQLYKLFRCIDQNAPIVLEPPVERSIGAPPRSPMMIKDQLPLRTPVSEAKRVVPFRPTVTLKAQGACSPGGATKRSIESITGAFYSSSSAAANKRAKSIVQTHAHGTALQGSPNPLSPESQPTSQNTSAASSPLHPIGRLAMSASINKTKVPPNTSSTLSMMSQVYGSRPLAPAVPNQHSRPPQQPRDPDSLFDIILDPPVLPPRPSSAGSGNGGLYSRPPSRRSARRQGILNYGNTCYQNAVLAALLALEPFVRACERVALPPLPPPATGVNGDAAPAAPASSTGRTSAARRSESPDTESDGPAPAAGAPLFRALRDVILARKMQLNTVLDPREFNKCITQLGTKFAAGRQEDAQELLMECLDRLDTEVELLASTVSVEESEGADTGAETRTPPPASEYVSPSDIFDCVIEKRIACTTCGAHVDVREPHRGWSLELGGESVTALLASFFRRETIEYACPRDGCDGKTATVDQRLASTPTILVVHLKRFAVDPIAQCVFKRADPVAIDTQVNVRDLMGAHASLTVPERATVAVAGSPAKGVAENHLLGPPQTSPQQGEAPPPTCNGNDSGGGVNGGSGDPCTTYRLYAVTSHFGASMQHGHYTADVLVASEGVWRTYDDSIVSELGTDADLQRQRARDAYLLYYVRCDVS